MSKTLKAKRNTHRKRRENIQGEYILTNGVSVCVMLVVRLGEGFLRDEGKVERVTRRCDQDATGQTRDSFNLGTYTTSRREGGGRWYERSTGVDGEPFTGHLLSKKGPRGGNIQRNTEA